jgi:hypothetical protein
VARLAERDDEGETREESLATNGDAAEPEPEPET